MRYIRYLALLLCLSPLPSYAAVSTTIQSAVAADGNGSAVTVYDPGDVGVHVSITGKASVNFEGSVDGGTTYGATICRMSGSTSGDVLTTNTSGIFFCRVAGLSHFRAPVVGWQTGTVTVTVNVQQATLNTLLACEDETYNLCMTSGGVVRQTTMTSGVTTNTTSAAVSLFVNAKSIYGQVVCSSGACVQTQAIYGDIDSDAANGVLLCTLTLSGTTRAQDACPVITANFSYYYIITTATSGTSATGAVYAMY